MPAIPLPFNWQRLSFVIPPIATTGIFTAEQIAAGSKQKYGKCLCIECGQKAKAALEEKNKPEEPAEDLASTLMAEAEK